MLGYIFGTVSVLLIVSHIAAAWAGSRFNAWLKAIPVIGKIF